MNMPRKKPFLLIVGVLLFLTAGATYALPPRVSWIPPELKPDSIAPGESASYTLILKHTGILPILLANQLKIVVEGDIVPFVTLTQPTFPPVFKKGNQVNVVVRVNAPATPAYLRKSGQLVLKRFVKGKEKEVWRANALPVEFTFSAISLPPFPDPEENNATIEGIDLGGGPNGEPDGVRDDINHYVAENHPNSAKVREALKQEARALTPFLLDADDKAKTRANSLGVAVASDCLYYVAGLSVDASAKISGPFWSEDVFFNTKERSRARVKANGKLGGTTDPRGGVLLSEWEAHHKAGCAFNPDSLPN